MLYCPRCFVNLWRVTMDLLTVREAGELWGITARMATIYCETGRIPGAFKKGNLWLIPGEAVKPVDRRKRSKNETCDNSDNRKRS